MKRIRRAFRYLTRSRALGAWMMFLVAAILYALFPANLPVTDTVKQSALIVASIGLSAIFLPELSSSLWDLKAADVSALVPEEKVNRLQRSIIESRVADAEWAGQILDGAIEPLVRTAQEPHTVLSDVVYTVRVHVGCSSLPGSNSRELSQFEASIEARRRLPQRARSDVFWVALARDSASLRQEHLEPGCIYREVSDLDPKFSDEEWRNVQMRECSARVVLDGMNIPAVLDAPYEDLESQNPRVLRWYFVSPELARVVDETHRIQICFDHVKLVDDTSFQAAFASYYMAEGLSFTFSVYPPDGMTVDLHHETFLGQALPHVVDQRVTEKSIGKELRVVTSDSSLIWPGSGIYVWWKTWRAS